MNKRLGKKDAFKAICEVERDSNMPSKSVFCQHVQLDRVLFNKLKLLGFVIEKSRNNILKNVVASLINEFENENGSLILLAKSKIQENDPGTSKSLIKNYKSIPEA